MFTPGHSFFVPFTSPYKRLRCTLSPSCDAAEAQRGSRAHFEFIITIIKHVVLSCSVSMKTNKTQGTSFGSWYCAFKTPLS